MTKRGSAGGAGNGGTASITVAAAASGNFDYLNIVADGFGTHIERGYVYSAMGFSIVVELINLRLRPKPHTDTLPVK